MAHRIIFTNTPSINYSLSQKFVVGSGVGSRNRSVYRALQNRASNNAHGKPCCIGNNTSTSGGCVLTPIDIGATAGGPDYFLDVPAIIPANCTLMYGADGDVTLFIGPNGNLTNNGTIIVSANNGLQIDGGGTITNNGQIYFCPPGGITLNGGNITINAPIQKCITP